MERRVARSSRKLERSQEPTAASARWPGSRIPRAVQYCLPSLIHGARSQHTGDCRTTWSRIWLQNAAAVSWSVRQPVNQIINHQPGGLGRRLKWHFALIHPLEELAEVVVVIG